MTGVCIEAGEYGSDEDDEESPAGTGSKQQEEPRTAPPQEGNRQGAGTDASEQRASDVQAHAAADFVEEEAVDYD